jgi:hypothetical protein
MTKSSFDLMLFCFLQKVKQPWFIIGIGFFFLIFESESDQNRVWLPFRSNENYSKKVFGQMNSRSNDLSVKWSFLEKAFGQMNFRSNALVRSFFSFKSHFLSKKIRSNDHFLKKIGLWLLIWILIILRKNTFQFNISCFSCSIIYILF